MKSLTQFISEKLIIKKRNIHQYFANSKAELREIIGKIIGESSKDLDLTVIDVSNVNDFEYLFQDLNTDEFETVDISNWDITNSEHLEKMFYGTNFKRIMGFDTLDLSNITSLRECFCDCPNLEKIDGIENISITSKCNYINWIFADDENLELPEKLDWDVSGVVYASGVFHNCKKIENLDLTSWNLTKIYTCCKMFYQCENLISIKGMDNWKFTNCRDNSYMFSNCKKLETVGDISNWDMSQTKNVELMFDQCKKLKCDISGWKFYPRVRKAYMYRGVNSKLFGKPKL